MRDQRNQDEIKNEVEDERLRKHPKEKDQILERLPLLFPQMRHYMNCGFNLLVYGVGSKRKFLNLFAMKNLNNEPTLIINGFHSAATMKSITNPMLGFAGRKKLKNADKQSTRSTQSIYDQVDQIKRLFSGFSSIESNHVNFNIVIHSMDAGLLKNEEFQNQLSQIATTDSIKIIIAVDHIKSGMLWSEQMLDRFNLIALEVNTYEDYDIELEYQSPLFSFKNDNQEVGLTFVLKSMTSVQRNIIKVIA